jgi:sialate O-acetylesterase
MRKRPSGKTADGAEVDLYPLKNAHNLETKMLSVEQYSGIRRSKLPAVLIFWFFAISPIWAEPVLPHLFSDHMVLQRDAEIRVWGWADPGEKISVSLAGRTQEIIADGDGHWKIVLPPVQAGGPYVLRVQGKKTVVYKDVMFGEVWVASGQSNMAFALSGAAGAAEEIPKANYQDIRFFTVPQEVSLAPQSDTLAAEWVLCSPETAKTFSAVSYFFARDLHKALGVPVGIILSARPGTAGEEWTDPDSLGREPILQPIVRRWEDSPASVKSFAARPADFSLEFDDFELVPRPGDGSLPVRISDFDDGTARTATGGAWTYSWTDSPGATFELVAPGRGGIGYAARVGGTLDEVSSSRLQASFHADLSVADMSAFSGIRFWVRGNGQFQLQILQPTIVDWDNYAAEMMQATKEWKQVTVWFKELKQDGWGVSNGLTLQSLTGFQIVHLTSVGDPPRPPSGLYQGMIAPLQQYRIRGAIWYQGEGNTWRAEQYRQLLPSLIAGWRKAWEEGDFPFLIVQLPNHGSSPELGDSIWAELREAQFLTARTVRNAGLAVSIDVGDPKNLHPPRKEEIGQRLALWALGTTYGKKIVYSGPLYDSMKIAGPQIEIHFRHVGGRLESRGGGLKGFAIAGGDHIFHWADARIDGDTVVVSSADVTAPVAVRYAWAGSPECNLYNKEGLPASPFRTDDWPGESAGNK